MQQTSFLKLRFLEFLSLFIVISMFSLGSQNKNFVLGEGEGYLVKTLAGNTAFAFDIGLMTSGEDVFLQSPCGICLGISEDMFVSDCGRHLIFRIFSNESVVVVGGMGFSGWNNDGYDAMQTLFNTPSSVSVALNGDVYVSDTGNDRIRIISSSTGLVSSISHAFNKPLGIFVSSNNIVYIADTGNNLIKKYDITTGIVSIIGGGGYLDGSNDNVDAKLLLLNAPTTIYAVSNGKSETVYFTDSERVKSIDSKGMYRIVDDTIASFYGIHISNSNAIWTTSSNSHFVQRKIIGETSQATIIGGKDLPDYKGDGLVNEYSNVRFYEPTSLVVKNRNVYIADKSNNCIRKIDTINKIVTTFAGGKINHPFGENVPPLENNPTSTFSCMFYYRNELYFVENSLILRKVSNGLVKTVLGSYLELKTPNSPTRTNIGMYVSFSFGNGEVVFSNNNVVFLFNIETLQLTNLLTRPMLYITGYGDSMENGTLFFGNGQSIYSFKNGNLLAMYPTPMYSGSFVHTNINSTTLFAIFSSQVVKIDLDRPDMYEVISTPTIQFPLYLVIDKSDTNKMYISEQSRIYEMRLNDSSVQLIAGLNTFNASGIAISFMGYNGENIPALKSALSTYSLIAQNGEILTSNSQGQLTLISNGLIRTVVGRLPTTSLRSFSGFERDEDENIIYLVDNRVVKKYNETSGETISITHSISASSTTPQISNPLPYPYFWLSPVRVPLMTFSKFDRMLYVFDSCRILQIDPTETLKVTKIAGNACGMVDFNVPAIESPLSPIITPAFTSNPNNGDLYFGNHSTFFKLEKRTGMIISLFGTYSNGPVSPDGMVDNTTVLGIYTYFRVVNDDIYFSANGLIRILEKQSDGGYYLRTLVGNGINGYTGDNLPALQSSLASVSTFYVKQNGDIIIIDSGVFLVRKYVKKTGLLKNLAGTPNQGSANYMGDLKGTDISFGSIGKSISVNEKTDEIYILESKCLRKLSISCEGMSTFNANNNTCSCLSGYYGDKCQPHSCNGTLASDSKTCSGNGKCTDFDLCVCKVGYTGQYCQLSTMGITEAALIVAIVVPICGCLLLIVLLSVLVIFITCCLVKKKRDNKLDDNLATIDSKNVELFDFPSNRSIVMSSSFGSSTGSDTEDAFSRYTNIVRIGQGAFGSVYKVTDTKKGNKTKAVKLVQFQSFSDLNSLMREATQLIHINHANILKVNDYFVTNDNLLCIDMDFYEKGDLTRFYKEDCPEGTVKQILRQMCDALNYVHTQLSIIHRDIKPSNIFIKSLSSDLKNIEIVLADFGLAKKHQEMNGQSYVGTPIYMSPEIALGSTYSFNTDLFSLGVSIYQIMTKDTTTSISGLLMGNQNAQSILSQQMKQTNVEYSEDLIQIVLQMLDKNQQTRPNASDILSFPYLNK